jgi:sulfite exporter TauE/SafE
VQWLAPAMRVAVGAVLVLAALRLLGFGGRLGFATAPGARLWQGLRPLQRRLLLAGDGPGKRIALGMLWGWMPCGLSTTLLAAAWLQADARNGALTMAAFGLGTLPLMLPLTWSGARLGQRLQRGNWRTGAGMLVLVAGLLTLAAPWLMQVPALHGILAALGCLPRTV